MQVDASRLRINTSSKSDIYECIFLGIMEKLERRIEEWTVILCLSPTIEKNTRLRELIRNKKESLRQKKF